MFPFPGEEPEIQIEPLNEEPPAITVRDLCWWFVSTEPGDRRVCAQYDYPARRLMKSFEIEVVGTGRVHDEECTHLRVRESTPEGDLRNEEHFFAAVREGVQRWFGVCETACVCGYARLDTYLDHTFNAEWEPFASQIVDAGRFHRIAPDQLETMRPAAADGAVNPIGAGLWRVRIGEREFRCLRFIDVTDPPAGGSNLNDGYLAQNGRVILSRHYMASQAWMHAWEKKTAAEYLAGCPTLTCDGVVYHLWYDTVPGDSLDESIARFRAR